jgi:DNA-binding MarR family transcriptional regulator
VAEPRGPLQSSGFWLHHAALAWRRQLDARLADLPLTHTQFNLLASTSWLGRDNTGPTQQQAATLAGADRMMASKVLASLEQRGLLVRRTHPSDTRAKRLEVTPEGRELVHRAVRIVAEIDEAIFGPAGPERDQLREQLRHIAQTDVNIA